MRFTFPAPKPPTARAGRINHRKDSLPIALFLIDPSQPRRQVPNSESGARPSRHSPGKRHPGGRTTFRRSADAGEAAPEFPTQVAPRSWFSPFSAGEPAGPHPTPDSSPSPRRVPSTLLRVSRRRTREPGAGRRAPSWPARRPPCLPLPPLAAQAVIMTASLFLLLPLASEPRTATAAAGGGLVTESCAG